MRGNFTQQADDIRRTIDQEKLSPQEAVVLRQRVDEAIDSRRPVVTRFGAWLGAAAASAAACAAVALFLWPQGQTEHEWFEVASGARCVSTDNGYIETRLGCDDAAVSVGKDEVSLQGGAMLARAQDGLVLKKGRARFTVAKRQAVEQKFRVQVSGGTIEVLGTVFDVREDGASGDVVLERGRIAFHWTDGTVDVMAPGERLQWPRARDEEDPTRESEADTRAGATMKAAAPVPGLRPRPSGPELLPAPAGLTGVPAMVSLPPNMAAVMQKLFRLRSQNRFADAQSLLRETLAHEAVLPAQKERLSFELGALMEDAGVPVQTVCAHWKEHLSQYPQGPLAAAARAKLEKCAALR